MIGATNFSETGMGGSKCLLKLAVALFHRQELKSAITFLSESDNENNNNDNNDNPGSRSRA